VDVDSFSDEERKDRGMYFLALMLVVPEVPLAGLGVGGWIETDRSDHGKSLFRRSQASPRHRRTGTRSSSTPAIAKTGPDVVGGFKAPGSRSSTAGQGKIFVRLAFGHSRSGCRGSGSAPGSTPRR
jgi:hypothetical protein